MSLTKVMGQMTTFAINVSALDCGVIANDSSKRSANTSALQNYLSNADNISSISFPEGTYYFESFTLPNRVISFVGAGGRYVHDNKTILDFSPTSGIAILAPATSPLSRFSLFQGLFIQCSTDLTNIGVLVDQGGLVMRDVFIDRCDIALQLHQSWCGVYDKLTLQGKSYGLHLNGASYEGTDGYISINKFTALNANNLPTGVTFDPTASGVFLESGSSGIIGANLFDCLNVDHCGQGIQVYGNSYHNTFINVWVEANSRYDIYYRNSTETVTDTWVNYYKGNPHPTYDDVFPDGVIRLQTANVITSAVKFPATQVSSADPNTLDDYQEGTWIATMAPSASGSITLNSSYNTGYYVKIGRQVTIQIEIVISSVSSPAGNIYIEFYWFFVTLFFNALFPRSPQNRAV